MAGVESTVMHGFQVSSAGTPDWAALLRGVDAEAVSLDMPITLASHEADPINGEGAWLAVLRGRVGGAPALLLLQYHDDDRDCVPLRLSELVRTDDGLLYVRQLWEFRPE